MASVSAGLTYMLDPDLGRRRRAIARDRFAATARRSARRLARLRYGVGAGAHAYSQRLLHLRRGSGAQPDDVTLTRVVESELFRHLDGTKGRINVDVAEGVVTLRGQLDQPDQIEALEKVARRVQGVQGIHNFLHLSGTPAPNKAAALEALGAGNGSGPER